MGQRTGKIRKPASYVTSPICSAALRTSRATSVTKNIHTTNPSKQPNYMGELISPIAPHARVATARRPQPTTRHPIQKPKIVRPVTTFRTTHPLGRCLPNMALPLQRTKPPARSVTGKTILAELRGSRVPSVTVPTRILVALAGVPIMEPDSFPTARPARNATPCVMLKQSWASRLRPARNAIPTLIKATGRCPRNMGRVL